MAVSMSFNYTQEQFQKLLAEFQSAIDSGKYTEKIPYDTWRKLKRLYHPKIEYASPFIKVYDVIKNIGGIDRDTIIFSCKTYDWGFGRFFYDEVIKKEWNKDMTLNATSSATFTCDNATINRNVWDQLVGISSTESNEVDYLYSDSTSGCPKHGTATNHTIKIDGDPLASNSIYIRDNYNGIFDSVGTATITTIGDRVDTLESQMEQLMNKNKKENGNMKGFNFDFGPCSNTVRLSMYGMAIQNVAGEWVSYNPDSGEIINVDVFNMPDGGKYMYKMPVAIADVAVGDVVIHNRVPMFVTAIGENGTFTVTDVRAGESKTIIPTRNMFGFNFMTKVVSLFNAFTNAPTADQPFGNMLPFLMCGEGKDIDPMMMFMMMNQGGTNGAMNSMMLYFMTKDNKDGKDFDPMMLFAMSNLMNQPAHICNCSKTPVNPAAQV